MIDIALMYIYPLDARQEFLANCKRWTESYLRIDPGERHRVIIVLPNGTPTDDDKALFKGIECEFTEYQEPGWDIGAYQHVAQSFDADLLICTNSRVRFWKGGWMTRFRQAYEMFGPKGLYGASASYEAGAYEAACPYPNPHIRTACFATNPKILRRFPYKVDSRAKGFMFESGQWNFMHWYRDHGWPVKLVTWDGFYDAKDWRKPQNVFRSGNQSNCLVKDRHHDLYDNADPKTKLHLEKMAGPVMRLAKDRVMA